MFRHSSKANARAKSKAVRQEPFTYIHRGTTLLGQLIAEGRVRVHGNVKGNVKVVGVLEVSQAGAIEGELIEADEVKILGRVRANVVSSGKVEIWSGGELVGNVRAASLDIVEGAFFTGTSEMVTADGTPLLAPPSGPLAELEAQPGGALEGPPERLPGGDEVSSEGGGELRRDPAPAGRGEPSGG